MPNTEPKLVHVAVAVIVKDNYVLLSKRADHVHQGGLWEFPGGKVESEENIEQALNREIQEELGIHINTSRPLISVQYVYPDKQVLLETRIVSDFQGEQYPFNQSQKGLEGQWVKWVHVNELHNIDFPKANQFILKALQLPQSYSITPDYDIECDDDWDKFLTGLNQQLKSHQLVQLRLTKLKGKEFRQRFDAVCKVSQQSQNSLMLNSTLVNQLDKAIDLTMIAGVHLTSTHLYDQQWIEQHRKMYPAHLIGASCHNAKDIEQANKMDLDFIVLSPVLATQSHPQQKPLGWTVFDSLAQSSKIPVFALGGMALEHLHMAQSYGAQGIAAIRGLWLKEGLKERLQEGL